MRKRINVVLPETTIRAIVANRSTEALSAQLEHTAVRDQDLDREIAADWFAVDHETC